MEVKNTFLMIFGLMTLPRAIVDIRIKMDGRIINNGRKGIKLVSHPPVMHSAGPIVPSIIEVVIA